MAVAARTPLEHGEVWTAPGGVTHRSVDRSPGAEGKDDNRDQLALPHGRGASLDSPSSLLKRLSQVVLAGTVPSCAPERVYRRNLQQSTIRTRARILCKGLNVRLSTYKGDGSISSVEHHFLEALVLGELVPEHHFHLCRGSVQGPLTKSASIRT